MLPIPNMAELTLPRDERLRLKSQSHHLDPIVLLGAAGLSEPALKEIDRALKAHGLIKVRLPATARDERERLFAQTAERLGAARVQLIGRLMVLFRPVPDEPAPRAARAAKVTAASGRRPDRAARPRTGAGVASGARPSKRKRSDGPPRSIAGKARASGSAKIFDAASRPRSRTGAVASVRPARRAGGDGRKRS
jgi:putative YhbY family RNA-binding protein